MQRRLFIFKVSLPHRHPGIRSGSSLFVLRDLPALHASRALSWVFFLRSTMPSFLVIRYELYTVPCVPCWVLLRRRYFCCVFPNAFACLLHRRFPHAFRHLFPYACLSCIHFASLLFLVCFATRCSKHFSRQNSMRIRSCAFNLGTQRVFLFITPCVPCEFPFIFPGHYTSLWFPHVSFCPILCAFTARIAIHPFPHVFPARSASFFFNLRPCFLIFSYELLNGSLGAPC